MQQNPGTTFKKNRLGEEPPLHKAVLMAKTWCCQKLKGLNRRSLNILMQNMLRIALENENIFGTVNTSLKALD